MSRRPTYIRRDYSRPFFRKQATSTRMIFLFGVLIGGILGLTYWQFDTLQLMALDAVGMAPTPTLRASDRAQIGMDLLVAGDVQDAERELRQAMELQPQNVSYLYEYGRVLIELIELDLSPDSRYAEVIELGDRIIRIAPDDPRGYALKARALQWSDPAAAIPIAITGLEKNSQFAPLHAVLAIAYTNIGRYQEGLARGIVAVQLDPNDAAAHRAYSYPLIYNGRYDEAIAQLEQAVAINPNLTTSYFELASLYRRINQRELAVGTYRRIIEIEPTNAKAYLRICETYSEIGEFRDGEPYCNQALEIDPNYASAWRALGQIQYARRNYESAITSFEECVRLGSEEIECWYLRGWAHYFLGGNNCARAWDILQESLNRTTSPEVLERITIGLQNITINCVGFQGRALPTPIPPTPIPPTPIGSF